jgi:hypothetical protein
MRARVGSPIIAAILAKRGSGAVMAAPWPIDLRARRVEHAVVAQHLRTRRR